MNQTWEQGQLLWWGGEWCEIILGKKALGVCDMDFTNSYIPGQLSNLPQTEIVPLVIESEEWL